MNVLPSYINIQEYAYTLPDERIARHPMNIRDSSKLLYYNHGKISTKVFRELPKLLSENTQLIFNDTRVIRARLLFQKASGSVIEVFLLEPFLPAEYTQSFASDNQCTWKCLVGNAKKMKNEILLKELTFKGERLILKAEKKGQEGNYFFIRFNWDNPNYLFSDIVQQAGNTPIPPYLKREVELADEKRYQTVYSTFEGSVAAPTAGLHFTEEVIKELEFKGISLTRITLHVGAGTFVPVKTENAAEHEMHTEHIYIRRRNIESLYLSEKKFIAVGTTSVRTLESLYHIAVLLKQGSITGKELFLDQWEAYNINPTLSRRESFAALLRHMDKMKTEELKISTRIMIAPGYQFRMTDGIITNFHQPASTLLLLVSAFVGKEWKEIYEYALRNEYRFLSYGDSSLLFKNTTSIQQGINI